VIGHGGHQNAGEVFHLPIGRWVYFFGYLAHELSFRLVVKERLSLLGQPFLILHRQNYLSK
ncbi:MAG TPA: hypothetical protein VJH89_02570, partial [Patescibacteria group bacterium]|nr:hypothetical protein [Patescibacteria group bacterium]